MSAVPTSRVYLAIDPGTAGGLAILNPAHDRPELIKMPEDESDLFCWLCRWSGVYTLHTGNEVVAIIEKQDPRPTFWRDKGTGKETHSILRSTVILYGSYMLIRGMLTGLGIQYHDVYHRDWQKELGLHKGKGKTQQAWKNELKQHAQQLYPDSKITLATSDALLMAHYLKSQYEAHAH